MRFYCPSNTGKPIQDETNEMMKKIKKTYRYGDQTTIFILNNKNGGFVFIKPDIYGCCI